jgi:hypothetical protein
VTGEGESKEIQLSRLLSFDRVTFRTPHRKALVIDMLARVTLNKHESRKLGLTQQSYIALMVGENLDYNNSDQPMFCVIIACPEGWKRSKDPVTLKLPASMVTSASPTERTDKDVQAAVNLAGLRPANMTDDEPPETSTEQSMDDTFEPSDDDETNHADIRSASRITRRAGKKLAFLSIPNPMPKADLKKESRSKPRRQRLASRTSQLLVATCSPLVCATAQPVLHQSSNRRVLTTSILNSKLIPLPAQ